MLQAMNTGHEGSLTTVHANSPRDALSRLETMVSMANLNIPERAIRQQIASAIHAVVQVARLSDGTRKVITISEITGMEGDIISMQDIFVFDRSGIDESGKVRGVFRATGIRPKFAERLRYRQAAGCGRHCSNRAWRSEPEAGLSMPDSSPSSFSWSFRWAASSRSPCSTSASRRPASSATASLPPRTPPANASRSRISPSCAMKCSAVFRRSTPCCARSDRVSALQKLLAQADVRRRAGNFLHALPGLGFLAGVHRLHRRRQGLGLCLGRPVARFLPPLFLRVVSGEPTLSTVSRRCFPRPSTRSRAPFAPVMPSPPRSR